MRGRQAFVYLTVHDQRRQEVPPGTNSNDDADRTADELRRKLHTLTYGHSIQAGCTNALSGTLLTNDGPRVSTASQAHDIAAPSCQRSALLRDGLACQSRVQPEFRRRIRRPFVSRESPKE